MTADPAGKTCFVVMGFGTKTDFPTGRTLDLDKTYRAIIKPAVEEAGLACTRADEIVHSGSIDVAMYRELLESDVVVADISTCNPNALYELGVRHALRPFTTVIIAEDKIAYPFDVSHILIRRYQHLGPGIDYEEATRFRGELVAALKTLLEAPATDSPVYSTLSALRPPALAAIAEAVAVQAGAVTEAPPAGPADETLSEITRRAEAALAGDEFVEAKALFEVARALRPNDPYLAQRLALATYKTKLPTPRAALEEARDILLQLDPAVSNDPETLGLWGSVHKRLWNETGDPALLDEAILAHERGFDIRNDSYNGINLAFLLNMRSQAATDAGDKIADFVNAQRVRRRVIVVCEALLATPLTPDARFFTRHATLAEAYVGIGDAEAGQRWLTLAAEDDVPDWIRESGTTQLARLRELLTPSPLEQLAGRPPHRDPAAGVTAVPELISFGGERAAVGIRVPCDAPGQALLEALDLPPSKGALVVVGSTAPLAPEVAKRIRSLLEDAVAAVAAGEGLAVLTGATDAGIFAVLGAALAQSGHGGAVVGLAPVHLVTWPDRADEGPDPASLTPLERHHSHFVLVDGDAWGDETAALVELATALVARGPVIAVLFGGGPIARGEVVAHVHAGVQVVVIAGSGRLANVVATAAEDPDACTDDDLVALVRDERLTLFPATGGPSELVTTLQELLG